MYLQLAIHKLPLRNMREKHESGTASPGPVVAQHGRAALALPPAPLGTGAFFQKLARCGTEP